MVHEVVQLLQSSAAAAVAVGCWLLAVVGVDDMFKSSNYSNFVGGGLELEFVQLQHVEWMGVEAVRKIQEN